MIKKSKKAFTILITLVIIAFLIVTAVLAVIIYNNLPHNEVEQNDRVALEKYIFDNYGFELKVKSSKIEHRGNIGINPGIEYYFILQDNMGVEYKLNIDYKYYEVDLQTILKEKPRLNIYRLKE